MVAGRDWATPPAFQPQAFRLRDAVDGPHQFTGHQKLGIMFQPDDCSIPLETTTACLTGVGEEKEPTAGANWRGVNPFALYTWLDCSLVGTGEEELRRRTLAAHDNNVQTLVEEIFWTGGDFTTYPHLASDDVVTEVSGGSIVTLQTSATNVVSGAAVVDVVEAIGLLEEAMGQCYGGTAIIHVPEAAIAHLAANHLLVQKNRQITTLKGSIVVGAPGYARTGPDGVAATGGNAWFYATGSVKWWQSDVNWLARDVRELLNRGTNQTVLIAEQWFGLGWDCCHFAAQVRLGGTITGTINSAT